ncbi:MAG: hypothetical protein K9K66_19470 [Desulfarculaceae bacterium]|nr:hypothetical protein [Desulfarculaceae bacterium]MCF8074212.1 hypothetical protein [Desulfarculaceae bacterium]MCF8103836.1 hypothetical protein [Desulfarculaceae bacterium]MCF8116352.1 hypothetical protein [Desulfarculaceae bacterium]
MRGGCKSILICLLSAGLALAGACWSAAQMDEPATIKDSKKRLDKLRIMYTDDHPEVIRLQEHLRKMKTREAEKKAEERAKDPKQVQGISEDFKSSQSFE